MFLSSPTIIRASVETIQNIGLFLIYYQFIVFKYNVIVTDITFFLKNAHLIGNVRNRKGLQFLLCVTQFLIGHQ